MLNAPLVAPLPCSCFSPLSLYSAPHTALAKPGVAYSSAAAIYGRLIDRSIKYLVLRSSYPEDGSWPQDKSEEKKALNVYSRPKVYLRAFRF